MTLENITFGYSPLDKPLLTGFSLTVGPGQQVALVGGSGSGKSTVSRLISGLYSPWEGAIRIDGQRLEDIPRGALAASVSFVDQDVFLFEGTVRDNVALWDPSIPDDAVVAALQDAALYDDVIARRPGGIHSRVEQDGRNFSGGQRQRLEIARALVRRPSILVLDEVTSALDARDRADHHRQPAPARLRLRRDRPPAQHGPRQRRDRRPRPRHGRRTRPARGPGRRRRPVRRAGQGALT